MLYENASLITKARRALNSFTCCIRLFIHQQFSYSHIVYESSELNNIHDQLWTFTSPHVDASI